MSLINVINVLVLNNPCPLTHAFSFEITFECLAPLLTEDLEWNVIYVGSAESSDADLVLGEVQVGPVSQGMHKFVLESNALDPTRLTENDILGVTVVLVTCTYREQEFVRIGYYVNNEVPGDHHIDDDMQQQEEEKSLDVSTVVRTILADKPRVTRFPIQWDEHNMYTPFKEKQQSTTCMEEEEEENMSVSMAIVSPPSSTQTQTTVAMEL